MQGFVCKITWHLSAAQTHGCIRPDAMDWYFLMPITLFFLFS